MAWDGKDKATKAVYFLDRTCPILFHQFRISTRFCSWEVRPMRNVSNFQTAMPTSVADTVLADVHWTIDRSNERVWISLQCREVTSV